MTGISDDQNLEWDWPPTKRYHKRRRARVEVLPPEQDEQEPRPQCVEIIFAQSHQQSTTNWPVLIVAIVAVLFLWRYSFALLLIGVMTWKLVTAMLMVTAVVAVAAWRERRHGRPF
jgi:hypothetical protein